jgi:radical SAM superfamily enzyme YgiQ (UPF0313 family)
MRIQFLHTPTLISPGSLQTATPTIPLGLGYVMAALREAGHECTLLDAIAEAPAQTTPDRGVLRLGLRDDQILARIDPDARAIAIANMFSFNWPLLRRTIHAIRERFADKIIVCGGEHFSGLPEFSMQRAPIHYVVMGEGEATATTLFARLDSGEPFDPGEIKGICWRRGEEIVRNPRATRAVALDEIPWPAWDLFDLEAYDANHLTAGLRFGRTIPILATRGCPYECTYCSSPQMWGRRWTTRDPVKVADEIETFHDRYGAENFPFQDLTMIIKKEWVVRFCKEIIRRKLDIRWQLPSGTRCEVVDDEVASLLIESGCRFVCYAPESGSERTRELIKKRMKTSSLMNAVESSVRAKLHLETFHVIGFPHDTAGDLRETVKLVRRVALKGVEDIAVNYYFPIPDTEIFNYLEKKGRVSLDDEQLMDPLFVHTMTLSESRNYCEHLTAGQLTRWKYWIVANFYLFAWISHPSRIFRILYNVIRGRQTSIMEKFLSQHRRRLVERFRRSRKSNPALPVPSRPSERVPLS